MRKIDKDMPYANRKLLEVIDTQAHGRVQRFAELVGMSHQRLSRLFRRDIRNGEYPKVSDEIKQLVLDKFNLEWDYFTETFNEGDRERAKRMEEAVRYLISVGMVDGRSPSKSVAERMGRGTSGISSALNGNGKYLTWKFVKVFCATYSNIISADWLWNGIGEMVVKKEDGGFGIGAENLPNDSLMKMSKEQLIGIIRELMSLHSEQTEMYRMLIRQNEQMIHNGQERFSAISNIIFKNI